MKTGMATTGAGHRRSRHCRAGGPNFFRERGRTNQRGAGALLESASSPNGQILSRSLSVLTRGFARAMASLPADLKSNSQLCCSGYLWEPQKVCPHLHLNPVSPTFLEHAVHRPAFFDGAAVTSAGGAAWGGGSDAEERSSFGWDAGGTDADDSTSRAGAERRKDFSTAIFAEASCSALRRWSR